MIQDLLLSIIYFSLFAGSSLTKSNMYSGPHTWPEDLLHQHVWALRRLFRRTPHSLHNYQRSFFLHFFLRLSHLQPFHWDWDFVDFWAMLWAAGYICWRRFLLNIFSEERRDTKSEVLVVISFCTDSFSTHKFCSPNVCRIQKICWMKRPEEILIKY